MKTERLDELFEMGLHFDGKAYVGIRNRMRDIYFPTIDIISDSDEQWEQRVIKVKDELKRRGL